MGILLRLAALFALWSSAAGQGTCGGGLWTDVAPLNVARQEVGAARVGDHAYVAGGLLAAFATADTVERYDPATDTWDFVAPMPAHRHHLAMAAEGGKLYALGGFGPDSLVKTTAWVYDPASDTWDTLAPLPEERASGWAVGHQGRIFVFGGVNSGQVAASSTLIYDIASDSWSIGADMLLPREHLVACAVGDAIYVIGGRVQGVSLPLLERYDPDLDAFTTLTPMPTARSAPAYGVWGSRIVVAGGEFPGLFDVTEVYDVDTDTWSCQGAMPVPRHGVASVPLDDGILVAGGGTLLGFAPTDHADRFRPASLVASPASLSISAGGTQALDLFGGADHAGRPYLVLGSVSGATPGFVQGPLAVPLNLDAYTQYTLANPNLPPLATTSGVLDGTGAGAAGFVLPPAFPPATVGLTLHHAFGILDPTGPGGTAFVSNAEPLLLLP